MCLGDRTWNFFIFKMLFFVILTIYVWQTTVCDVVAAAQYDIACVLQRIEAYFVQG